LVGTGWAVSLLLYMHNWALKTDLSPYSASLSSTEGFSDSGRAIVCCASTDY